MTEVENMTEVEDMAGIDVMTGIKVMDKKAGKDFLRAAIYREFRIKCGEVEMKSANKTFKKSNGLLIT